MKFFVCLFLASVSYSPLVSPKEELSRFRQEIYLSYLQNDLSAWEKTHSQLVAYVKVHPSREALYELLMCEYGLLGFYHSNQKMDRAEKLLPKTEKTVDKMLNLDEKWAAANALKGSILGFETLIYPAKTLYLGPRSLSYLSDGVEYGPDSPEVWVEKGNVAYHAPAVFGGDKRKAVEFFQKAIRLFDQNADIKQNHWMYLHSLSWLGMAYVELGEFQKARETYTRLARFEPRFTLVNRVLLPELEAAQRP